MDNYWKRHFFKDSFFYRLLGYYIFFLHRLFYKEIIVEGKEHIPEKGPLIFAPNHQNALMDPLAILFATSRQIVFLARADIFRNPLLRKIFYWLKILPVYRIRDGMDQLKNNDQSFDAAVEVLQHKRFVGLFPEAAHSDKWSMLPLKKGVSRLALLAESRNDFKLGLKVVPAGIFYSSYDSMGSVLHIRFGEAFPVSSFKESYESSPQRAAIEMRETLQKRMEPLAINIRNLTYYNLYMEILRYLLRSDPESRGQGRKKAIRKFRLRKQIIASLDRYAQGEPGRMEHLESRVRKYADIKHLHRLNERAVALRHNGLFAIVLRSIGFLLLLPLFLYGMINHLPIYLISRRLIRLFKDKQFHSSVKFLFGALIAPVFYLLQSVLAAWILGGAIPGLIFFATLPVSGLLAHAFHRKWKQHQTNIRRYMLENSKPSEYNKIVMLRQELNALLKEIPGLSV